MTKDRESQNASQTPPPSQDSAENYDIVTCPSFDYSISSLTYSIASTDFMADGLAEEDDRGSQLDTIQNEHAHSPSQSSRATWGKKNGRKSSRNCHSPKSISKMVIQEDEELRGLRWTE